MSGLRDPKEPREEALTGDDLAVRIIQGDDRALGLLASRHIGKMKIYAFGILRDHAAAEDVAWEVIEWIWEHRSHWQPRKVGGFLMTAVKSRALNRLRKKRSERFRAERWARQHLRHPPAPDRVAERRELRNRIQRAIDHLPPRQRQAFVLTRIDGLSYREAGEEMELSPRTVEHHVEAAIAKLHEALKSTLADSA